MKQNGRQPYKPPVDILYPPIIKSIHNDRSPIHVNCLLTRFQTLPIATPTSVTIICRSPSHAANYSWVKSSNLKINENIYRLIKCFLSKLLTINYSHHKQLLHKSSTQSPSSTFYVFEITRPQHW